ncbi:hypothetical protein SH2C18_28150 [Clostridium sediminicola]
MCVLTLWIYVLLKSKNFSLITGLCFFSISMFTDTLDELRFIVIPEWTNFVFEKIFLVIGFLIITVGIHQELKDKRIALKRMSNIAYKDFLTKLPNRRAINEKIEKGIEKATKYNKQMAIFLLDFDNFKYINDVYGHECGDRVLIYIANRLKKFGTENRFIGRLGGDEYLAIVENVNSEEEVFEFAQDIIEEFNMVKKIDDNNFYISVSIGGAIFPQHGENRTSLLRKADIAMYNVKKEGKNGFQLYNKKSESISVMEMNMKAEIINAIKNNEFIVYYHPIVSVEKDSVKSAEALIRWKKSGKVISPGCFIPITEKYGLASLVDFYMLKHVCEEMNTWKSLHGVYPFDKVSINLSSKTMMEKDIINKIKNVINESGVPSDHFTFEITETSILQNYDNALKKILSIQEYGCSVSLDDFGTGFSSLNHLRSFPINSIKIDKTFIDGIGKNQKDEKLVQGLLSLADSLDIDIIAEGVETREQIEFLSKFGCKFIQGYYYYKPMEISEINKIVNDYS